RARKFRQLLPKVKISTDLCPSSHIFERSTSVSENGRKCLKRPAKQGVKPRKHPRVSRQDALMEQCPAVDLRCAWHKCEPVRSVSRLSCSQTLLNAKAAQKAAFLRD